MGEVFRRLFNRRAIVFWIIIPIIGGAILIWKREPFREVVPRASSEFVRQAAAFNAESAYEQAQRLIENAQAHEFKGKKAEVAEKYVEAVRILDEIAEKDPAFQPEAVAAKIKLCEDKIRKAP